MTTNIFPGVPLIESPLFPGQMKTLGLTADEERIGIDLHRQGYAVFDFPDAELDSRIKGIKRNLSPRYDVDLDDPHSDKTLKEHRIQDAWSFDENVRAIASNEAVLELLSKLYGRRAFPFQTLNFPVGTQQPAHSDSVHFSSLPERFMCGVWLAMEDVVPEAGPLSYFPGSHRWPILSNAMIGRRGYGTAPNSAQDPFGPAWAALCEAHGAQQETFLARKGQALIWCANLLHGGSPQIDARLTRWSQVTHYYFDDCIYYTPALSDESVGRLEMRNLVAINDGQRRSNIYLGEIVGHKGLRKLIRRFVGSCKRLIGLGMFRKSQAHPRVYRWSNPWLFSRGWRRRLPGQATIPARAILVWNERPDLQSGFPLGTKSGREGLIWWYLRHGYPELGLKFDPDDEACSQVLNQAVPGTRQLSFLPITWLVRGLADRAGIARSSLRQRPGQEQLLNWFYAKGLMQANLPDFLTQHQARSLLVDSADLPGTPQLLICIWSISPHLQKRFSCPADPVFREWCINQGAREFPILAHPLIALASPPARRSHKSKPFGVNLFGHAHGRSGISEDVRMAAKALAEAGIPFAVHNVSPGAGMPDEEHTTSSDETLPYAINLFAMTAAATVPAILQAGPADVGDCYNIGFWPWEMPEVPEFWQHAYDWVDEVWASSRFTYDSFCRSSPRPVRHMPFAVSAEESDGLDRAHFGLPSDKFLFGFAFDGLSSFARKAPLANLRAFQKAFPQGESSVGLVLKGMRVSEDPQWKEVLDAVAGDDRIHLVTSSLPRGSLLDLWRALDCFVSLHRSEGFGRNIAEAMLLGKPAVATAHSGNMDFTRYGTAALVPCKLRPAKPGEYPYCTGQLWAEPDIGAAAALMQRVVTDATWREGISEAGRQEIAGRYSFKAVGTAWSYALRTIYEVA